MSTIHTQADLSQFALTRVATIDEGADVVIPPLAHTFGGFRAWAVSDDYPDHGQFTFAEGELIIDMSPEAYETHNCIKSEISSVIYQRVKRMKSGRFFGDRFLLSNAASSLSTEPDATFVTNAGFESGRCRILKSTRPGVCDELVGSPDWVLEILSRSSVRKDTRVLFDAYCRAGVGEYWLINALGDEVEFQIFRPGSGGFVEVMADSGWHQSACFGCEFQLTRAKASDGMFEYTLSIRENA